MPLLAILDSGANQTILGKNGLFLLEKCNLSVNNTDNSIKLQTADGQIQGIVGSVKVPITINEVTKNVTVLVSDTINAGLTLGMDCCLLFGIVANFKTDSFLVSNINSLAVDRLSVAQNEKFQEIIHIFKRISGPQLGRTNLVAHKIDTGNACPIKQRYFPMSPYMLKVVNKEIDKMLDLGVIRPSKSPWSSPFVMVKKKNGEMRFCFDGRKLNSVTKRDAYPLPFVNDILNKLRDAKFLSSIDLKKAFWQIPLEPESCEKTAFTVPRRGLFEFTVLPFGLHNSPQTLQRLMDTLLGPRFDNVFVYLDDIIVASPTIEDHLDTLRRLGECLEEAGLSINFEKCEFCKSSLTYLGYVVDEGGLRTDPNKVKAIVEFPIPRTTTEIKRFLGMAGWYRRFVPNFSTFVSPILALIKGKHKRQSVSWSLEANAAFTEIKQLLASAPILASPDFSKPFIIQTDASDVGLGAVLLQGDGESERVIAYASRALNTAEKNYSATEKECLAVLFGIEKYRPYIEGIKFTVVTDHFALLWLHKLQNPTGRLARWSVRLQQYSFVVEHRKGKFNVVPDALSRAPIEICTVQHISADQDKWYHNMLIKVRDNPEKFPDWRIEKEILYKFVANNHNVISNLVEWKRVLLKKERKAIIRQLHDDPSSGHFGIFKTLSRVAETYYWPKMKADISRYVKKCHVCLSSKASNRARAGLMGAEKKISFPFQLISVDLMGPFPRSKNGNTFLLVVADWFTKFVLLQPLRKATAKSVVNFLENQVFLVYGVPQIIMCDNGVQFQKEFRKLAVAYKIPKLWFNALYHAQVNPVERVNRVVGTALRSYIGDNHRCWDEHIHKIGFAIRNSVHEVTGHTPSFLNFGRSVPISGDFYSDFFSLNPEDATLKSRERLIKDINALSEIYVDIVGRLREAYLKNKHYYDLRKRSVRFKVGDIVWKKNMSLSNASEGFCHKLAPKYIKCCVKEVTGPLTYRLVNEKGRDLGIYHVKDLKPNG